MLTKLKILIFFHNFKTKVKITNPVKDTYIIAKMLSLVGICASRKQESPKAAPITTNWSNERQLNTFVAVFPIFDYFTIKFFVFKRFSLSVSLFVSSISLCQLKMLFSRKWWVVGSFKKSWMDSNPFEWLNGFCLRLRLKSVKRLEAVCLSVGEGRQNYLNFIF